MKDNELRGLVLQRYYDRRRQGTLEWTNEDLAGLDLPSGVDLPEIYRVSEQLSQHGLIEWMGMPRSRGGGFVRGAGKITAFGVDVIEGTAKSPVSIIFDHSVSVTGSHVQIGNNNVQEVTVEIGKIVSAINGSTASEAEKAEAKSLLKTFLEHPIVASVLGGAASQIHF